MVIGTNPYLFGPYRPSYSVLPEWAFSHTQSMQPSKARVVGDCLHCAKLVSLGRWGPQEQDACVLLIALLGFQKILSALRANYKKEGKCQLIWGILDNCA